MDALVWLRLAPDPLSASALAWGPDGARNPGEFQNYNPQCPVLHRIISVAIVIISGFSKMAVVYNLANRWPSVFTHW
jgi:hypothetical protein